MSPRVLFVSKPVAPPFHDGTKCLVRDVAFHLLRYRAQVLTTQATNDVGVTPVAGHPGVEAVRLYRDAGTYTPALLANARAAAWLVARSRADLWHFVFAPNRRTSEVGRMARRLRRVPVVQTVASAPRTFEPDLFFGDVVVAQSRWTRDRVLGAFRDADRPAPHVAVVPPPVGLIRRRSDADLASIRRELDLPERAPVFVYPGDLEVSSGADTVADAVPLIAGELPDAIVVFACRPKTERAPILERALAARLSGRPVRFTRTTDLPGLLTLAAAVLFPVDDLYGKVDLPISLLEAMQIGVPVVALSEGPLADLEGTVRIPARDPRALARAAVELVRNAAHRSRVASESQLAVAACYAAPVVAAAYERVYDIVRAG